MTGAIVFLFDKCFFNCKKYYLELTGGDDLGQHNRLRRNFHRCMLVRWKRVVREREQ